MPPHFKIRPNFPDHEIIKEADDAYRLRINFKSSGHISAGISETFRNLRVLEILGQSIFKRSDFANMEGLMRLGINDNKIEFLPEDVFWDLPNLEYLTFGGNQIKELPENIFMNLKNLEQILFCQNKIEHLPKNLFENNQKITSIAAYDNPYKKIDVDFEKLPKLFSLSLFDGNCIKALKSKQTQAIKKACSPRIEPEGSTTAFGLLE